MKKAALFLLIALGLGAGGVKAEDAAQAPAVKRCEAVTGSRIQPVVAAGESCERVTLGVRSYSREELQATGRVDVDEALSVLDPSILRRL